MNGKRIKKEGNRQNIHNCSIYNACVIYFITANYTKIVYKKCSKYPINILCNYKAIIEVIRFTNQFLLLPRVFMHIFCCINLLRIVSNCK